MVAVTRKSLSQQAVQDELKALHSEAVLRANRKRGDNHGVNLSKLRALAKKAGRDHERAQALWATGDTAARLVAILTCDARAFTVRELDTMLRSVTGPKETDWLERTVIAASPHIEALEKQWRVDDDGRVEAVSWKLINRRILKAADAQESAVLLDEIEQRMALVEPRLQWAMNEVLATIGIHQPLLRDRAIAIGERLQVFADYPVSAGCVAPFAPIWISEMVRRQEQQGNVR